MLSRREILQVGCSSFFGLGLSGVLQQQLKAATDSATPPAKSVVLIYLGGGGSHLDMFDPKPLASETKGEFSPIPTAIPGFQFTDRMPHLAQHADLLTIVRSMSHKDNRHLSGTHHALTGAIQPFRGNSNQDKSLNRADWPSYGSALSYLDPRTDQLPSQVTLPNDLIEGVLVWPGQHAGFLGPKYDPFILKDDPNSADYKVRGLALHDGLNIERLNDRKQLLLDMDRQQRAINESSQGKQYSLQQEMAFSMLTSPTLKDTLDVYAEPDEVRDRYGRHLYGQTLLLARRLVEIEMPVIQCNMGRTQTWDTHVDHFPRLKNMLPPLDQGVSAFLVDLKERGLLDQTLVICVGEFGRTPTISPLPTHNIPGRHHWAPAYSALFAGAGVQGGQVIGETDKIGAYPITPPYSPSDMGATIYTALGVDPHQMIPDRLGRPRPLNDGKVMDVLYTGAES
ncbi:hypothetical protein Pla110_38920 [Polystyrenella longa]|uniref:DUF1501 domain-containing protein n=1 Tax=Polystyrenella longa TaxID=2528007 RepID=A0A518CSD1_9PLAN|nr:DUF1501 domain-containing protein [Polystyrenella longa]QDU82137.1 hypothetical protein Pla110_38920 [Polystyrenella longa]